MRVWGSEIVFAVLLCGTLSSTAQPHHNHRRFSQTTTTATVCPVHSLLDFVLGFPDSTCPLPDSLGSIAVTEVILPLLMYYCKFSITVFVSSYWSFALLMTREMRFLCRRRWIWFTRIITSMWLCSSMRHGALSRACLDRFSPCSLHCTLPFLIFLLKNPRLGRGLCNAFLPSFFFSFVCVFFQLNAYAILAAYCPNMVSMVSLHCSFWILPCGFGIMVLGHLLRSLVSTMMLQVRHTIFLPLLIHALGFVCCLLVYIQPLIEIRTC